MYGATEELVRDPEVAGHDGRGVRLGDLAPTDARLAWAQRCAPVIMQPELDITLGFGLRRVFFDFREDRTCEVSLVYNGEASYQHSDPLSYNRVATFFYRSFVRDPSPPLSDTQDTAGGSAPRTTDCMLRVRCRIITPTAAPLTWTGWCSKA